MSDPTAPVEGAPASTPSTESAPGGDPYAPVLDRMGELSSTINSRLAEFEQRLPAAPEPPAEADPWAALFGEPDPAETFEPTQPALDPAALQNAFQTALQQANAPLMQQVQQMQQERARETLLARIPALKDPQVANATVNAMYQSLTASGAQPDFIQWALQNPDQIALHFEAAEAKKLAAGQAPASEQVPNAESAGGALPGGNGAPVNPVHQAYAARPAAPPSGFL